MRGLARLGVVEVEGASYLCPRASELELRSFLPLLDQTLDATSSCSTKERGPDTGIFSLRLLVRKLLPF